MTLRRVVSIGCLLAVLTDVARAQAPDQQARAAREAWARASAASRAGEADSAWSEVRRAHDAYPAQPVYTQALARMAARRGEAEHFEATLRLLTAQGVGTAVAEDSTARAFAAASPTSRVLWDAFLEALAPVPASDARLVHGDSLFFAEGVAADPRSGTLYVTSLRHPSLLVVPEAGPAFRLPISADAAFGAVMGVAVDESRDLLWLTTSPSVHAAPERRRATRSELLRVGANDGAVTGRWVLGDGAGVPGEIALTDDGDVLVSDASLGRLYRLRAGRDAIEVIEHALLRSVQGIAVRPDGRAAVVADWAHGLLLWDLEHDLLSPVVTPGSHTLVGIDGLRWHADGVIAVQNGVLPRRILAITLSDDASSVTAVRTLDRPATLEGEPTVGTIVGGRYVYVSSSAWPFWNDEGQRLRRDEPLPAVVLRSIRLSF